MDLSRKKNRKQEVYVTGFRVDLETASVCDGEGEKRKTKSYSKEKSYGKSQRKQKSHERRREKMGEERKANTAAATQPSRGKGSPFPFCYHDIHHEQKRVGGGKCLFQLILYSPPLREVRRQEPGGRK